VIESSDFAVDFPIKDIHGHCGTFATFNVPDAQGAKLDAVIRQNGISEVCIAPFIGLSCACAQSNRMMAELSDKYSSMRGLCLIDPYDASETENQLAYCFEANRFAGLKFHPYYNQVPDDHKGYEAALAYADKHKLFILWHYGGGVDYLRELSSGYPNANFVLAHYGTVWNGEACDDTKKILELVAILDNVYTDLAGSVCYLDALPKLLDLIPYEKVLFGSDLCFLDAAFQLGQTLRAAIPAAAKYAILCGNYDRIVNPG